MRPLAGLAVLAILTAAPCAAQVDANPAWVRQDPAPAETRGQAEPWALERYYPQRARDQEVPGRTVIDCAVTAQGALSGCRVVSEK